MTMLTKNTDKLRQEVAAHVAADSIVQKIYWDTENNRGCFIGCLAKSDDPIINEATYGLPVMLQRIAESIFEALPADDAKAFFAALPDAIACDGKDLTRVAWQFLAAADAAWATDAAWTADAARLRQRDLLLRLISEAPVVENHQ